MEIFTVTPKLLIIAIIIICVRSKCGLKSESAKSVESTGSVESAESAESVASAESAF